MLKTSAKFALGQVVRHRVHPFRGVIFDVDPTFNNTDEWWESIPEENRPHKDQPFYHLLAENETRCSPPKPDRIVRELARDITSRYQPEVNP